MSIHDFIGYPLIAWNDYNRNPIYLDKNTRCYISARLADKTGFYETVNIDRIEVELYQSVESFHNNVGPLVEIQMLDAPSKNTNPNSSNPYFMWYSKTAGKTGIIIEQYKGDHLLQIVRTPSSIDNVIKSHSLQIPSIGILTKRILVECNGIYYGPLEHSKIDEHYVKLAARKDDRYYIGKYYAEAYESKLLLMTESFGGLDLLDVRHLPPFGDDNKVDFFSDAELRDLFLASLDIKSREHMEKLRTFFNIVDSKIVSEDRERRISQILRNLEHQDTTLRQIAYYILATKDLCENVMDKIIKERLDVVVRHIPESGLKINTDNLPSLPESVPGPVPVLPVSTPTGKGKAAVSDPATERQVSEQKALLLRLTKKYEGVLEKANLADEIDYLRTEADSVQSELKTATAALELAQKSLGFIRDEVKKEAKFITESVDKSLLDLVLRTFNDREWEGKKSPPFSPALLSSEARPQKMIERVQDVLQRANWALPGDDIRNRNEIANYLICLTQGFVTTFYGEPGTGKTSLCRLLAKALGLVREDDNNRFVEVAVEHGWDSPKDFVGQYNPQSKSMEIANRKLFNALSLLDQESRRKMDDIAPFCVLLDDANISSVERYWSQFLRICDFDSATRSINLGGNVELAMPNHLRFLATVGGDNEMHEGLSMRYIDRSWIIMLVPEHVKYEPLGVQDANVAKVISFNSLLKAFAPKDQKIDATILEEWDAIQTIFSSNKLPINPRNLKMVRNYFQVAFSCMDTSQEENRFAPLDYAVSQKILPTINGMDKHYGDLLEALLAHCSGMLPMCCEHIQRMKATSEQRYYSFFLW
ncbi:MAG: AAA family ATPase [Planctomycetaceae bacterium]|nr:AAA family ATPase [Planctomycetaceae bacterium]